MVTYKRERDRQFSCFFPTNVAFIASFDRSSASAGRRKKEEHINQMNKTEINKIVIVSYISSD